MQLHRTSGACEGLPEDYFTSSRRSMKMHTGDTVLIISGKDKGKSGSILRVLPDQNRVVVAGINMRTRHFKKTPQQAGRKVRFEASLSASNVMILDPKTKKPSRIGYKVDDKGKKKRIAKLSGELVAHVKPTKEAKKKAEAPEKKAAEKIEHKEEKAKGAPFWKKMGFGSAVTEEADVPEQARSEKDQSIPAQEMHIRKGGRGT